MQTTVEVLVGHVKGLRLEVEALSRLITDPPPTVLRVPPVPAPEELAPPSAPKRPSMAVKAARDASSLGKVVMIGTGVLTVAGQLVSLIRPEYTGPIVQALRLLASLGGAEP